MKTSNYTSIYDKYDSEVDVDIGFGLWLTSLRVERHFSLFEVHQMTMMPIHRIRSLELGEAPRGITLDEVNKLALVYDVSVKSIVDKAISG